MRRLIALAALWAGCGALDPELGEQRPGGDGTCELIDSDPAQAVTYEALRATVFRQGCGCHTEPGGVGRSEGGLDLDDLDALRAGGRVSSAETIVVPGDPCESVIVQKTGTPAPFGARMPYRRVPLAEEARQMIIDWVAEGANP